MGNVSVTNNYLGQSIVCASYAFLDFQFVSPSEPRVSGVENRGQIFALFYKKRKADRDVNLFVPHLGSIPQVYLLSGANRPLRSNTGVD